MNTAAARNVTKDEFFAVIGPLDVHPRVDISSLRTPVHISNWEIQSTRQLVGRSESSTCKPTRFFLYA